MRKTFKFTVHFGYLAGAVLSSVISYMTINGTIQNYIHFSGVDNEIGFFFAGILLTSICLIGSFSATKTSTK